MGGLPGANHLGQQQLGQQPAQRPGRKPGLWTDAAVGAVERLELPTANAVHMRDQPKRWVHRALRVELASCHLKMKSDRIKKKGG